MTKRRGAWKAADKYQKARAAIRSPMVAGREINTKKIAEAQGVSVDTVERAALAEQARADLLDELGIDPATLAPSAKAKLEAAKRAMTRQLQAELAARMRGLDEEVRQRVLAETKDYLAMLKQREAEAEKTIALYQEWLNNGAKIFTSDQFKLILMCLHPDGQRSAAKLTEAFRLFNSGKVPLTGER